MNFANLQKQNAKKMVTNVKQLQETASAFDDRENQINGWKGTAATIIDRHSPTSCSAVFGSGGGRGSCVGA